MLVEILPGSAPTIVSYRAGVDPVASTFAEGIEASYIRSYGDHYASVNPWMEFWRTAPAGGVFVSERDSPARLFRDSEFYVDWLAPQGNLEAAAGMRFEIGSSDAVHVAWHYDLARSRIYDSPAAMLLENLRPAFEAAVTDAGIMRDALENANRIGTVIEHVDGAAMLVDRQLTLKEANTEAVITFRKGDILQDQANLLSIRDSQAQRWLEETVERLIDRQPVSTTALVFSNAGRVYRLMVSLLPNQTAMTSPLLVAPRAMVLVILRLLVGGRLRIDHAALKVAFGLSLAEVRLCEALINGMSLKDAAHALGLSDGTVRQRVKMVFHKTHTHRQGELIAALGRFASPE